MTFLGQQQLRSNVCFVRPVARSLPCLDVRIILGGRCESSPADAVLTYFGGVSVSILRGARLSCGSHETRRNFRAQSLLRATPCCRLGKETRSQEIYPYGAAAATWFMCSMSGFGSTCISPVCSFGRMSLDTCNLQPFFNTRLRTGGLVALYDWSSYWHVLPGDRCVRCATLFVWNSLRRRCLRMACLVCQPP